MTNDACQTKASVSKFYFVYKGRQAELVLNERDMTPAKYVVSYFHIVCFLLKICQLNTIQNKNRFIYLLRRSSCYCEFRVASEQLSYCVELTYRQKRYKKIP